MRRLVLAAALAGCGGGEGGAGGIPGGTPVVDLTDAQIQKLCESFATTAGTRTVTCGNGEMRTFRVVIGDCVQATQALRTVAECTLTVGQYQDCIEAQASATDDELCTNVIQPECNPVVACSAG